MGLQNSFPEKRKLFNTTFSLKKTIFKNSVKRLSLCDILKITEMFWCTHLVYQEKLTSGKRRYDVGTTSVLRRYNVVVPGVPWGAQTLLQRFFYLVLRTANFAELHPATEESITEQPDATNRAPHILLCTTRFCFC